MTGSTPHARWLQAAAVVVLLAWGTLDQARFYLALHSDDLNDLKRAARLTSTDSPLQMRLARKELDIGDAQEAEAAWKRAIDANPADPLPRQELLKFLLDQKRFDDALKLTEASLKTTPGDASLLVNHGLLALQLGQSERALRDWNDALKIDPGQSSAHLYLAHELDREGKAEGAAEHYRRVLEKIASQKGDERAGPEFVIGIILRMADCQARFQQEDAAAKSYQMAEKLAGQTGQARLESIADLNQAQLQAKSGKVSEALRLYQRTLELDHGVGDQAAEAVDWFAYGRFLHESGFPARLAYACMVKAETEAPQKNPLPSSATQTRRMLEKQLGAGAAVVRNDLESAVKEAVGLRP